MQTVIELGETIEKLIDDYIAWKEEPHKSSGKFNPSSFGQCFRKQVWKRRGVEPTNPPDNRTLRVFEVGKMFEDFICHALQKNGVHEFQVLVEEEDVKGFADFVTEDEVGEVKSTHSNSFHHVTRELKTKSIIEIKKGNVLQATYYALKLGKQYARLIFCSKDDLCIQTFKINVTDVKPLVEEELATLRELWGKKENPPALPRAYGNDKDGTPRECSKYCQFRDKCLEVEGDNHPLRKKDG